MLDADRNEICEVLKFSDEPRSWFIGNSVQTGICCVTLETVYRQVYAV